MQVQTLLLGGTGQQFFYYLGGVTYLEMSGQLSQIQRFIGVGAGAFLAALLAARISPATIFSALSRINRFFKVQDFRRIFSEIPDLNSYALLERIPQLIRILFTNSIGKIPTFGQLLQQQGTRLEIVVTNLTDSSEIVFNADSYPNQSVMEPILFSLHLPLLTQAPIFNGIPVASGVLTNPLPVDLVELDEPALLFTIETPKIQDASFFIPHLFNVLATPIEVLRQQQLRDVANMTASRCVVFRSEFLDFLGITLQKEDNHKMVRDGQRMCADVLSSRVFVSDLMSEDPKPDENSD